MDTNSTQKPNPGVTSRIVQSFDGTEIHYDLYDADSDAVVVVVPGFWRDRSYPSMGRLGRFLTRAGYRAAIIDVRGHGDSGGVYGFNFLEHYDVRAVADDILALGTVSSIALIGFSVGGAIAVSTAARHTYLPIRSLLLISSVGDFARIVPKINLLHLHRHIAISQAMHRPRFDWRFAKSEKLNACEDIADVHVPVSLLHVRNDWLISHRHSQELYERANEPKEIEIFDIEGNYHADRIFGVAAEKIEPRMLDFLGRTIRKEGNGQPL
ncbi:MAG: alpha/beta fold hydrolase [Acidobacteriota bacterium]